MSEQVLGVIGGSGLYDIDGLVNKEWKAISSPFGKPSDELLFGELDGQQLVFLPRHGRGGNGCRCGYAASCVSMPRS